MSSVSQNAIDLSISCIFVYAVLSKTDLRLWRSLSDPSTLTEVAAATGKSPATVSRRARRLEDLGLVRRERHGRSVLLRRASTSQARLLDACVRKFPRTPWENLLSGSGLAVMYALRHPVRVVEAATETGLSPATVSKVLGRLSRHGVAVRMNHRYGINPLHEDALEFARALAAHWAYAEARAAAPDALLIWSRPWEGLFRATAEFAEDGVQKAALSRFPDHGLPITTTFRYGFLGRRSLDDADVVLHTLLIDPTSPTYHAYAALYLLRTRPENLARKARIYDLEREAESLERYLEERPAAHPFHLPWDEFQGLVEDYGVR
jgi:DNA-binding MarR family transcriptional regulator